MSIRAIETEWNGYRFRSRTEARWGVFLNALSIPFEYEAQGFDMDGLRYLPDFWLPRDEAWLEIKGEQPTANEDEKARRLCEGTKFPVFIFVGAPWLSLAARHYMWHTEDGAIGEHGYADCQAGYDWENGGEYYQGVMAWMWDERKGHGYIGCLIDGEDKHAARHPKVLRAYREARGARFEHYPKNMRRILEDGGCI